MKNLSNIVIKQNILIKINLHFCIINLIYNSNLSCNLISMTSQEIKEDLQQNSPLCQNSDNQKEINVDDNSSSLETITLSSKQRWGVFTIISVISLLSNLDNGIVPASTQSIKDDLKANDSEIGLFGSGDYLGRIISSVIFIYVLNKINRQYILAFSLFFKALNLAVCLITYNYYVILLTRCLCGFSQVYYTIYFPVWCDQFGTKKSKPMMIAIIQIGCPLGIFFGFCLSTFIKSVRFLFNCL